MNEAANQLPRKLPDDVLLPVGELDLTLMFLSRSGLRKKQRPDGSVRAQSQTGSVRSVPATRRLAGEAFDRLCALLDDVWMGHVQIHVETEVVAVP